MTNESKIIEAVRGCCNYSRPPRLTALIIGRADAQALFHTETSSRPRPPRDTARPQKSVTMSAAPRSRSHRAEKFSVLLLSTSAFSDVMLCSCILPSCMGLVWVRKFWKVSNSCNVEHFLELARKLRYRNHFSENRERLFSSVFFGWIGFIFWCLKTE